MSEVSGNIIAKIGGAWKNSGSCTNTLLTRSLIFLDVSFLGSLKALGYNAL